MSRRPAPTVPKPAIVIAPSATIADTAVLTGTYPIVIGGNTVIHPRAKLNSTYGSVTVGERCIVHEKASIGISSTTETKDPGVKLAEDVVVEATAVVEATEVGKGTVVEVGARVGIGAVVGQVRLIPCDIELRADGA